MISRLNRKKILGIESFEKIFVGGSIKMFGGRSPDPGSGATPLYRADRQCATRLLNCYYFFREADRGPVGTP